MLFRSLIDLPDFAQRVVSLARVKNIKPSVHARWKQLTRLTANQEEWPFYAVPHVKLIAMGTSRPAASLWPRLGTRSNVLSRGLKNLRDGKSGHLTRLFASGVEDGFRMKKRTVKAKAASTPAPNTGPGRKKGRDSLTSAPSHTETDEGMHLRRYPRKPIFSFDNFALVRASDFEPSPEFDDEDSVDGDGVDGPEAEEDEDKAEEDGNGAVVEEAIDTTGGLEDLDQDPAYQPSLDGGEGVHVPTDMVTHVEPEPPALLSTPHHLQEVAGTSRGVEQPSPLALWTPPQGSSSVPSGWTLSFSQAFIEVSPQVISHCQGLMIECPKEIRSEIRKVSTETLSGFKDVCRSEREAQREMIATAMKKSLDDITAHMETERRVQNEKLDAQLKELNARVDTIAGSYESLFALTKGHNQMLTKSQNLATKQQETITTLSSRIAEEGNAPPRITVEDLDNLQERFAASNENALRERMNEFMKRLASMEDRILYEDATPPAADVADASVQGSSSVDNSHVEDPQASQITQPSPSPAPTTEATQVTPTIVSFASPHVSPVPLDAPTMVSSSTATDGSTDDTSPALPQDIPTEGEASSTSAVVSQ